MLGSQNWCWIPELGSVLSITYFNLLSVKVFLWQFPFVAKLCLGRFYLILIGSNRPAYTEIATLLLFRNLRVRRHCNQHKSSKTMTEYWGYNTDIQLILNYLQAFKELCQNIFLAQNILPTNQVYFKHGHMLTEKSNFSCHILLSLNFNYEQFHSSRENSLQAPWQIANTY